MATARQRKTADDLIGEAGTTYAREAGIPLKDTPAPLFQLLVLTLLLSARISAEIAVDAAKELFDAGVRTPEAMRDAKRSDVLAALQRGHYVRYDESTATALAEAAERTLQEYGGDLRRLNRDADENVDAAAKALTGYKSIGEVGAHIFLREVQDTWTWVRPHFDDKATDSAEQLGLPRDPAELAALAPEGRVADLAAALIRVSLDHDLFDRVVDRGDG